MENIHSKSRSKSRSGTNPFNGSPAPYGSNPSREGSRQTYSRENSRKGFMRSLVSIPEGSNLSNGNSGNNLYT